jgi:acetyl-CoA carboxylase biotin carboxyl carrier protein
MALPEPTGPEPSDEAEAGTMANATRGEAPSGLAQPADESDPETVAATDAGAAEAAELIALIDRLEGVLERSGLAELEVGSGATTIVLRSATAVATQPAALTSAPASPSVDDGHAGSPADAASTGHRSVTAPLTGIYYGAPSPDAAPYVRVGGSVVVGQVIGLIEAMKLYNEIKSDIAGRVVRVVAENGKLVKAKQALIEVEPS